MPRKKRSSGKEPAGVEGPAGVRATALTHHPFAALGPALPEAAATTPRPQAAGAAQTARPTFDRKLVIRRETKGRGGKTVTRISGLPAAQRESLRALMKKKLGCGAVVEGEDVLLLGDLVDRAADCLIAEGASRIVKGN